MEMNEDLLIDDYNLWPTCEIVNWTWKKWEKDNFNKTYRHLFAEVG